MMMTAAIFPSPEAKAASRSALQGRIEVSVAPYRGWEKSPYIRVFGVEEMILAEWGREAAPQVATWVGLMARGWAWAPGGTPTAAPRDPCIFYSKNNL